MDTQISQEQLVHLIASLGRQIVEGRQVAKRVKQFLPNRLKSIERDHRRCLSGARSLRRALLDPAYLQSIDEYLELAERADSARVAWQTHRMLYRARLGKA